MIWIDVLAFAVGIALLIKGADLVTDHASKLATKIGISQLVIGMTIVAFSTSLPEFAVSMLSAIFSTSDIATGTIIGSNIANIGLILGLSALASPLLIDKSYIHETRATLFFTLLVSLFLFTGLFWLTGLVIISLSILYMKWLVRRKQNLLTKAESLLASKFTHTKPFRHLVFITIGAAAIVIGANIVLTSSINIAHFLNVSTLIIAMIAIALGTSLPELATSLVAAIKKMRGISVGNVIGSNIFNISILASASLIRPIPVTPHVLFIDIPVMIAITLLLLFFMKRKLKITRPEGAALLAIYILFLFLQLV